MNFFSGKISGKNFVMGDLSVEIPAKKRAELERLGYSGDVILGIRPEHVKDGVGNLPVQVELVELIGSESIIFGLLHGEKVVCKTGVRTDIHITDTINMDFDMNMVHFFDAETEVRIPIQA